MFTHRVNRVRLLAFVVVLALMGAALLNTTAANPVQAAVNLTVNTTAVAQNDFIGLSGVYHGFTYMPESTSKGMTDALRTIEFDRVVTQKLRLARTWYGSDWAMPTYGGAYDWNSTKMTAFYNWLQAMKDRGVDVALSAGWWFTQHTCDAGRNGCTPRIPEDVDIYTKWVSDSVHHLINVRGFTNVKYLILFTEPLSYNSGTVPPGYSQTSYYELVGGALHTRLVNDGRRNLVKIVGPNGTSLAQSQGLSSLQTIRNSLNGVIDIYSGHDYSLSGYQAWNTMIANAINITSSTGKPFWMDEYGKQDEGYRNTPDYGTYLAEAALGAINAGAQTSMIWLFQDQYYTYPLESETNGDAFYNGLHKWGSQPWLPDDLNVRAPWYAYGVLSRYLGGPGTQVYDSTRFADGIVITATKQSDGNWTFAVVNTTNSSASINVSFTSGLNRTLYRYLYNPANVPTNNQPIGKSATFNNVSGSFSDNLPARAVAVYSTIDDGSSGEPDDNNLAFGRQVTASSSFESDTFGWGKAKAVDGGRNSTGNSNGYSSNNNTGNDHAEWIQIDLGSSQSVGKVDLYPRNDGTSVGQGFPKNFTIETAADDNCTMWNTVYTSPSGGYPQPLNGSVQSFTFGSTSARCVRVNATSLYPNPFDGNQYRLHFAEIEVYAGGGGNTNRAIGAAVTATSSVEDWGWFKSSVNDGQTNSVSGALGWTSNSNTGSEYHTQWIQLDMGSVYSISEVKLFPRNDGADAGYGFPVDFTIQLAGDSGCTSWSTVYMSPSGGYNFPSGGTVQTFSFNAQNAKCVRVQGTRFRANPLDGNLYRMQFAEIEIR